MVRMMPKIKADQKPAISKPGTMAEASIRRSAFRASAKIPSVNIVMGRVSKKRMGFTTVFMTPIASAATNAAKYPST